MNLEFLTVMRGATIADAALIYAANGWAVFPCIGKEPAIPGGRGFHDATTDIEQIKAWWRRWPDANIAGALQPGTFALDEDPRHAGDFARAMLERAHAPLPLTLRQVTGGGGYHWIFRAPDDVAVRQLAGLVDGVDTRVAGKGYLMLAPSVHPETGRRWAWNSTIAPVMAPGWLLAMVRVPMMQRLAMPPRTVFPNGNQSKRKAEASLQGIVRAIAAAGKGERNNILYWGRCRAAEMIAAGILDGNEAHEALYAAGIACGLSEREVQKAIR